MGRPYQGYRNAAGTAVPGTTTVCGIVKDSGGLIQWAYKQGRKHGVLEGQGRDAPRNLYDDVDVAAKIGTLAHECCEANIKGLELPALPADERTEAGDLIRDQVMQAFNQFLAWKHQTRMTIIATEVPLVSEAHQFGGTLDFVCEIDGVICLGDFKTSGAVYPEMLMQLAAYRHLWNERRPDQVITGPSHLLRISKSSPDFGHYSFGDLSDAWELFLLARRAYDLKAVLKKRTG